MVAPRPFLSEASATRINRVRQRGAVTAVLFWPDTYEEWVQHRPETNGASWDTATAGEAWTARGTGTGKLFENGAGGPTTTGDVIYVESPYRFRTHASAGFDSTTFLVINGTRLFRVDAFKVEDQNDLLANAYLSELIDTPLPVAGT